MKTVVITGGTRGIGAVMVRSFLHQGMESHVLREYRKFGRKFTQSLDGQIFG